MAVAIFALSAGPTASAQDKTVVTVHDGQAKKSFVTEADNVADVLERADFAIGSNDLVEPGLDEVVDGGAFSINIYRARMVTVVDGSDRYIVSTAYRSPEAIAAAAGYSGHRQVTHTGGGPTGSANAIWLKEFGKWKEGVKAKPTLIPAIVTREWDVMTWGPYMRDKPEYYSQWIDLCLQHNPQTIFYLQDAWPRFDAEELASLLALLEAGMPERKTPEANTGRRVGAPADRGYVAPSELDG